MNRILIDTNIYSNPFRGDPTVISVLQTAEQIGISSISIGELLAGFKRGSREKRNSSDLEAFIDSPRVVVYPVDMGTAGFYKDM